MAEQVHAGRLKGHGDAVWYSQEKPDGSLAYWCGSWHERTPEELLRESLLVVHDLLQNHPELVEKVLVKRE